jgi:hypothetical protein
LSSRGPTCCTTRSRPTDTRASSEAQRPGQTPDHRSQKRLDWHTCMPPVDRLHRHLRVSSAFITRQELFGAQSSANCAPEGLGSPPAAGTRHRASSEAHRASPGRSSESLRALNREPSGPHRVPSGPHRVPPGTHRNLRVPSNAPGRSPADPSFSDGPFEAQPHDPRQRGRLRSSIWLCSPASVFGHSSEPPGSTRASSETQRSPSVHTRRSAAIASFRYKGPLVRRTLIKLCNVSGATVVTFESAPDFRLSYRR